MQLPQAFRWTQHGKQFRRKAGTRSWAEAEDEKRRLEEQLAGRVPEEPREGLLLEKAIETFDANKAAQGIKPRVCAIYTRELKRLRIFSEGRGLMTVKQALTIDNLIALRATWTPVYKSSYSRAVVQKHLNHFLRFCYLPVHEFPDLHRVIVLSLKHQRKKPEHDHPSTTGEGGPAQWVTSPNPADGDENRS